MSSNNVMSSKFVVKADVNIVYSDSEAQTSVILVTDWEEFFTKNDPYGDFPQNPTCSLLAQGCSTTYVGFLTLDHANGEV